MRNEISDDIHSLFVEGKYEEVLDLIKEHPDLQSEEIVRLKEECRKFVIEQYVYLLKELVREKDYTVARKKKSEFFQKYGSHLRIDEIEIPVEKTEEVETPSLTIKPSKRNKVLKIICTCVAILFVVGGFLFYKFGDGQTSMDKNNSDNVLKRATSESSVNKEEEKTPISGASLAKYGFTVYYPKYLKFNNTYSEDYDGADLEGDGMYLTIRFYKWGETVKMYNEVVLNSLKKAYNWEVLLQMRGGYVGIDDSTERINSNVITASGLNETEGIYIQAMKNADETYYCVIKLSYSPSNQHGATIVIDEYLKKMIADKNKSLTSETKSLVTFFEQNVGKYPYEIKMLDAPLFKSRLITLVGERNYHFICTYFEVQSPIEKGYNNDVNLFCTSGFEAHNAGVNDIKIVYNSGTDNLMVRIMKSGGTPLIYQEKQEVSPFE